MFIDRDGFINMWSISTLCFAVVSLFLVFVVFRQKQTLIRLQKQNQVNFQDYDASSEQVFELLTPLLAHLNHELRTPLNAIMGYSEIMTTQMMGPLSKIYADYAASIYKSGEDLMRIINDLSLLYDEKPKKHAADTGRQSVFPPSVEEKLTLSDGGSKQSLRTLYNLVLSECSGLLHQKELILKENLSSQEDMFVHHGEDFARLFKCLLENSLCAPQISGTIHCSFSRKEHILRVSVADNIAMSEETIGKAFIPFATCPYKKDYSLSGTGLALPIAYRLAKQMKGHIIIESPGNFGRLITVLLPIVAMVEV